MISSTKLRQSLQTAISSPVSRSFWGSRTPGPWAVDAAADDRVNALANRFLEELRSNVLLLLCGRAGLCGGRLCGPSMLRDIIELLLPLADPAVVLSLAPLVADVTAGGWWDSESDRASPCRLVPGVLEVERWFFGDDGALPTVLRVLRSNSGRSSRSISDRGNDSSTRLCGPDPPPPPCAW